MKWQQEKNSRSLNLSEEDAEHFSKCFANFGAKIAQSKPTCMENNAIRQQHSMFKKKID